MISIKQNAVLAGPVGQKIAVSSNRKRRLQDKKVPEWALVELYARVGALEGAIAKLSRKSVVGQFSLTVTSIEVVAEGVLDVPSPKKSALEQAEGCCNNMLMLALHLQQFCQSEWEPVFQFEFEGKLTPK